MEIQHSLDVSTAVTRIRPSGEIDMAVAGGMRLRHNRGYLDFGTSPRPPLEPPPNMTAADRDFVRRSRRLTRSHHLWDDPIVDHPLQRCEVGTATAAEATHPGPVQLAAMLADDLDPGTPVRAAEDAEDHAWNARRRAPSATEARPKATPAALGLAPHERDPPDGVCRSPEGLQPRGTRPTAGQNTSCPVGQLWMQLPRHDLQRLGVSRRAALP